MKVRVEDNPLTRRIWDEWLERFRELSEKTEKERLDLCEGYQWLFPKRDGVVNLESLYKSVHVRSNWKKLHQWFYVISTYLLSRVHLGENSYYHYQRLYKKLFGEEGSSSEDFPQKVLLIMAMLGYITGLSGGYCFFPEGEKNHGYPFILDKERLLNWDCSGVDDNGYFITVSDTAIPEWVMSETSSITFEVKGEDTERMSWTMHPDWLGERQYQSISSVEVLKEGIVETSKWMFNFNEYKVYYNLPDEEQEELMKNWISYQKLRDLSCGIIGGCLDDSHKPEGKGYAGRFYTCMTNMRSDHRHRYLRLDGELVTEVDVSSAQPTFLGVLMYKETGVMSEWLRQCLCGEGDFYEWIREKTQTQEDRKTIKKWMMQYLYSCYQPNKGKDYDKPHRPTYENKRTEDPFLCFQQRLNKYLKENEPEIYNKIDWFKRHPVYREDKIIYKIYPEENGNKKKKKVRKGKWCSMLSYDLVKMEVEYIKRCIHSLPEDMKFWTIHDCICVKESDSLRVKEIMEQVSREMYGENITIRLKRENTSKDYS